MPSRHLRQGQSPADGHAATDGAAGPPSGSGDLTTLCNLYSITTNQAAISALFRVVNRYVGNLAPMAGAFPDYTAPIVRSGPDGRELALARWDAMAGAGAPLRGPVQQLQRIQQGRRRRHLDRARRDAPAALFRRHLDQLDVDPEGQEGEITNDLYAFLTTDPNAEVGAVHPKAMPVILTTPAEVETWMTAPTEEALKLQRPVRTVRSGSWRGT